MMNSKTFLKTICRLVIIGIFLLSSFDAFAATSNGVFTQAYETIKTTFVQARNVVYVVSGFGLVGIATAAIFGKLSFRWLAMICIGLATLAAADKIVDYSIQNGINIPDESAGIGEDDFELNLQFDN